jgi:malonate transporter
MILSVTLPFFALIFLGYIAARQRWVPPESIPAFNGFLLYFAVPAMLFRFASVTPFRDITNGPYFVAWALSGTAVVLLVAFVMRRVLGQSTRDAAFYGFGWTLPVPRCPRRDGCSSSRCATAPMPAASARPSW